MAFKKVIDRQRAVRGLYSVQDVSAGQEKIQDIPSNINVEGTRIDADLLNPLQAGLIFEFDSVNSIEGGKDIYSIEVSGLISSTKPNDYPLQNGMTFQIKINTTSTQDQVLLRINGDEYDVAKVSMDGVIALEKGDLIEGMYYHITYNGTLFIVENFSLPFRERTRGIGSGLDIRKGEILNILGLDYGGDFGTNLTSIQADKVYFYKDTTSGRSTPYVALADNTGTFITPDTNNFRSLSIRDNLLYKNLTIATASSTYISLSSAFLYGNMLYVNGFVTNSATLNTLAAGTVLVNIATMIPELVNSSVYNTTITGSNLDIKYNFNITKAVSTVSFVEGEHFTITVGLNRGTIR